MIILSFSWSGDRNIHLPDPPTFFKDNAQHKRLFHPACGQENSTGSDACCCHHLYHKGVADDPRDGRTFAVRSCPVCAPRYPVPGGWPAFRWRRDGVLFYSGCASHLNPAFSWTGLRKCSLLLTWKPRSPDPLFPARVPCEIPCPIEYPSLHLLREGSRPCIHSAILTSTRPIL